MLAASFFSHQRVSRKHALLTPLPSHIILYVQAVLAAAGRDKTHSINSHVQGNTASRSTPEAGIYVKWHEGASDKLTPAPSY